MSPAVVRDVFVFVVWFVEGVCHHLLDFFQVASEIMRRICFKSQWKIYAAVACCSFFLCF